MRTIVYTALAVGIFSMGALSCHERKLTAKARQELSDSLDLTTKQFSELEKRQETAQSPGLFKNFMDFRDSVGKKRIEELSPTPKTYDSAMAFIESGKQTYSTVYNNMKNNMKKTMRKVPKK